MIENTNLLRLMDGIIPTYHDCLKLIMCETPTEKCHLRECSSCPGIPAVQSIIPEALEMNVIETVTLRQWLNVD